MQFDSSKEPVAEQPSTAQPVFEDPTAANRDVLDSARSSQQIEYFQRPQNKPSECNKTIYEHQKTKENRKLHTIASNSKPEQASE